jgi:hypothetical protein
MTVVLTDLPTNPGTPVPDMFEKLATHLFETRIIFLKVPPEQIVWIERVRSDDAKDQEDVGEMTFARSAQDQRYMILDHIAEIAVEFLAEELPHLE